MLTETTADPADSGTISLDEFQALEQKVLRAVEIVRREREARAAAEAEAAAIRDELHATREDRDALREQLSALTSASNTAQTQITSLSQEREAVRLRVEKMMAQIDELL